MKRKKGFIFIGMLIIILLIGIFILRYNVKNKAKKIEQCVLQRIESNVYEDDAKLRQDVKDVEEMKKESEELCGDCGNNCHSLCDGLLEGIEKLEKNIQESRKLEKSLDAKLHCHREAGYSNYELGQLGFSYERIYGL